MMGELADTVLSGGGEVIGIIPESLASKELAHPRLSKLEVVGSMHERKARMAELADGFIALPGGLGTLEELFEILTWNQLGLQSKPCALLNVSGYYDSLCHFLDHSVSEGFVTPAHRAMLLVSSDAEAVVEAMRCSKPPV